MNIKLLEKKGILTIIINRLNQHNALNLKVLDELEHVFNNIYQNKDIKGVIITGAGNKSFVAGADIKEFADYSGEEGKKMATKGQKVFKIIEDCPKPVLAAVNGYALGGGCELAMACHLRIASNNAIFGLPEVKLGIIPAYGGTQRMTRLIGKTMATELILTGETISAKKAKKIGLINKLSSSDNLMIKSENLLKKIMGQSLVAVESAIKCINDFYSNSIDGYNTELNEFLKCVDSKDFKEGISAFLEKREPRFKR